LAHVFLLNHLLKKEPWGSGLPTALFLFTFGSGSAHGRKIGIGVIMLEIKKIPA